MEVLELSPEELKDVISLGKVIGEGFFGTVFTYRDRLIKLDSNLYFQLRANAKKFSNHVVREIHPDFSNPSQIEELVRRQPNITLTKLPLGIVTIKDTNISPGIIIPYHRDHDKLETLARDDYKKVLIILRKLLDAVKELADNQISQEDLIQYGDRFHPKKRSYNVLYQGDTPQIIDLSGRYIKAGKEFQDALAMYNGLGNIILDYFTFNGIETEHKRNDISSFEEAEEMIDELDVKVKRR